MWPNAVLTADTIIIPAINLPNHERNQWPSWYANQGSWFQSHTLKLHVWLPLSWVLWGAGGSVLSDPSSQEMSLSCPHLWMAVWLSVKLKWTLFASSTPGTYCHWGGGHRTLDNGLSGSGAGRLEAGNSGSASLQLCGFTVRRPGAGLLVFTLPSTQSTCWTGRLVSFFNSGKPQLLSLQILLLPHCPLFLLEFVLDRWWRFSVSCLWLLTALSHFYLFCFLYYVWMSFSGLSSNSLISL